MQCFLEFYEELVFVVVVVGAELVQECFWGLVQWGGLVASAFEVPQAFVGGDAVEPGFDGFGVLELADVVECLDEDFL